MTDKKKVIVLGGGVGSLTTTLALTDPDNWVSRDWDVTIYQLGWRLGGKGASGRNPAHQYRIEEHGLHIWFGYYNNAFRLIRKIYAEAARAPDLPLARVEDAFAPHDFVLDTSLRGRPGDFIHQYLPDNRALPGDGVLLPPRMILFEAIELLGSILLASDYAPPSPDGVPTLHPDTGFRAFLDSVSQHIEEAVALRFWNAIQRPGLVQELFELDEKVVLAVLDVAVRVTWERSKDAIGADPDARSRWLWANFLYAQIAGLIREDVLTKGFFSINDQDYRDFIGRHAFDDGGLTRDSSLVRAVYDGAFAYVDGDNSVPPGAAWPPHANLEAGTALASAMLVMLTNKGAPIWKMQAGMGEVVFAPIWEVLQHRGVKVHFFCRVTEIVPSEDMKTIDAIVIDRQARVLAGETAYRPLFDVKGLPCWPSEPFWDQLADGEAMRSAGVDFEAWESGWPVVETLRLERGKDFDEVILGIPVSCLPYIAPELVRKSEKWKRMVDHVSTTRTMGAEVWLSRTAYQLGWKEMGRPILVGNESTQMDTWADMTHLVVREGWPVKDYPLQLTYFVGNMRDTAPAEPTPEGPKFPVSSFDQREANEVCRRETRRLLDDHVGIFLPAAVGEGGFRWELLVDPSGGEGPARLDTQYFRGNVQPNERYTLSVVGSSAHRLPANDTEEVSNLFLAGDWTLCGMNVGCVEASVMSGLLASSALTGRPAPEEIVGWSWMADPKLRAAAKSWREARGAGWSPPSPPPPTHPADWTERLSKFLHSISDPLVELLGELPTLREEQNAWIMYQAWQDVLFMSWALEPEKLRRFVPASLELDLFEGKAYVSQLPLYMNDIRPFGLPPIPGQKEFPEINLRVYVRYRNEPGVYFISLDASDVLASFVAEYMLEMPYRVADMSFHKSADGTCTMTSVRRSSGAREEVVFRARYRGKGTLGPAPSGSLTEFLCERDTLFVEDARGVMFRGKVQHAPWQVQDVDLTIDYNDIPQAAGLPITGAPHHVGYSPGTRSLLWRLEKVGEPRDVLPAVPEPEDPTLGLPWIMEQDEVDAAFLYWKVDAHQLRKLVPAALDLELRDGQAWVGMIPFRMANVHVRGLKWLSRSWGELDFFTFVHCEGGTGLYFINIDADTWFEGEMAKLLFAVPYRDSEVTQNEVDGTWHFHAVHRKRRLFGKGEILAEFEARWTPEGDAFYASDGSLEDWLTSRYVLFTVEGCRVRRGEERHLPWSLRRARVEIVKNTVPDGFGLTLGVPDVVLSSPGVRVREWPVVPLDTTKPEPWGRGAAPRGVSRDEALAALRDAKAKFRARLEASATAAPSAASDLAPYAPPGADCHCADGIPPTDCSAYEDACDWLPPAFVRNATCACKKTPDVPSANAVRKTLQIELANVDPAFQRECREKLAALRAHPGTVADYELWVAERFAPVAYEWHKKAYRAGCCPCGPAPFVDWVAVCTIPIPFCEWVDEAIDWFGSCDCTPGKW